MKLFIKFFWLITVIGLLCIGVFVVHKLFFEHTAHGQVAPTSRSAANTPREVSPKLRPPVEEQPPAETAPESPAETTRMKEVEVPAEVLDQLIEKKPKPAQHSETELYLSFAVLAFGFLVMFGQFLIMIREHRYFDNMSLKMLTITMAITSALFLITAGFSSDQIQPAIGLISGTLGFAFGLRGDTPQTDNPPAPPAAGGKP